MFIIIIKLNDDEEINMYPSTLEENYKTIMLTFYDVSKKRKTINNKLVELLSVLW